MDLERESTKIRVDTNMAKDIAVKCNELIDLQNEIKTIEEKLNKVKEQEKFLSEHAIPSLMQSSGISMIKLEDGTEVKVSPYYYAKISEDKKEAAFTWLRENGFGDLIKNNISLDFGMNEDSEANNVVAQLKAKGYNVFQSTTVHSSTLKAFVKEQITEGKGLPEDLFGIYTASKTKLTTKE
jgi:hypothetical protein